MSSGPSALHSTHAHTADAGASPHAAGPGVAHGGGKPWLQITALGPVWSRAGRSRVNGHSHGMFRLCGQVTVEEDSRRTPQGMFVARVTGEQALQAGIARTSINVDITWILKRCHVCAKQLLPVPRPHRCVPRGLVV